MSLADELMADLEEDELDNLEQIAVDTNEEIEEAAEALPVPSTYENVHDVAQLSQSEAYIQLMEKLEEQLSSTEPVTVTSPLESDPQYQLIVRLSHMAADVDHEINVIHKFVRDKYEKRFPELETLVLNPLDYIGAVKLLGNDINTKGQNRELLGQILQASTCIVVAVTASTTQGKPLDNNELASILEACELATKLQADRVSMHRLVEMRMALIAPNLVAMLGAATTAMLVSQAGGLTPLSRMPSCNIQVLGAQKRVLTGFSSANTTPHTGFLYYHPIVQSLPPDLRKKAAKLLAAKCTLAARVDSQHESSDGAIGQKLGDEIRSKIEKLMEPPPVKAAKPLPKPLDKASKKRGGRRVRKMKERLGLTDLRKKANRMNFGELGEDVMQDHIGFDIGQIKSSGIPGGRIRTGVVDNKTKARMSQKLQRQMERQKSLGGATSVRSKVAGTASSVTFTPVQGLEIVNPTAVETKDASSSSTYFSSAASFIQVKTPKP